MQCPNCLRAIPAESVFCLSCGTQINAPDSSSSIHGFYFNLLGVHIFQYLEQRVSTSDYSSILAAIRFNPAVLEKNLKRQFPFEIVARLKQELVRRFGPQQAASLVYGMGYFSGEQNTLDNKSTQWIMKVYAFLQAGNVAKGLVMQLAEIFTNFSDQTCRVISRGNSLHFELVNCPECSYAPGQSCELFRGLIQGFVEHMTQQKYKVQVSESNCRAGRGHACSYSIELQKQ
jgi:hypothetical protein